MDEDSIKDGEKVRRQFYKAREQATEQLAKIASELIQRSVELYRTALSQAAGSVLLKQKAS